MLASGAALLLIPLAIAVRRDRAWHKPLGRSPPSLVVLGALTSLPVAVISHSVAMARAGFFAQGIVWLALIALGVAAIRRRSSPTTPASCWRWRRLPRARCGCASRPRS